MQDALCDGMKAVEFESKIRINIPNPYILVSKRHAETLRHGWRKPMPVLVQVNDRPKTPWRINMMPKGDGSFYLYLHGTFARRLAPRLATVYRYACVSTRTIVADPRTRCLHGSRFLCQITNRQRPHGTPSLRAAKRRFCATSLG